MPPIVLAEQLRKQFDDTVALDGLDLQMEEGTILALLGPNGAGKTTAVRIFTTLSIPDSGRAEVAGFNVASDPGEVRKRIGVTGQYAAVDDLLTGRENLEMIGRLFRLPMAEAEKRAQNLLERLDLADAGDRIVKGYSGGMRRRLDLAASMIVQPPVVFLDEPTTGLDPAARLDIWALISDMVKSGTSILLTTQYLEEADRLADQIIIMNHGTSIATGTAEELKRSAGAAMLVVRMTDPSRLNAAMETLQEMAEGEVLTEKKTATVSVPIDDVSGQIPRAVRLLDEAQIGIDDIGVHRPTLDDVFLSLTGHTLEEEEELALKQESGEVKR